MKNNKVIYEHLRHRKLEKEKFVKVKNPSISGFMDKPFDGGLWASPIESKYNWRNQFYKMDEWEKNNYFEFTLADEAKVLYINTLEDVNSISKDYILSFEKELGLDFEKLSSTYDAIYVNPLIDKRLGKIMPHWECESILVFNLEIIETSD